MVDTVERIGNQTQQFDPSTIQLLLEAISSGNNNDLLSFLGNSSVPMLKNMLDNSELDQNQQLIINSLLGLSSGNNSSKGNMFDGEMTHLNTLEEIDVDSSTDSINTESDTAISDLIHELEDLRYINNILADALGACRYCWGSDNTCYECAGEGVTGADEPDIALFDEFVAPAITRVRTMKRSERKRFDHKRR